MLDITDVVSVSFYYLDIHQSSSTDVRLTFRRGGKGVFNMVQESIIFHGSFKYVRIKCTVKALAALRHQ